VRFILFALFAALFLASCGPEPAPAPPPDPTTETWYTDAVSQLVTVNRQAEDALKNKKPDDASALILQGEPIESQVLAVRKPTLAAMEAASDLDDLYGRMLFSNKHYDWAEFLFQKNIARWKYWQPQTDDTARRMKDAQEKVAACDQGMLHLKKPKM
jgi:hypothetical protein